MVYVDGQFFCGRVTARYDGSSGCIRFVNFRVHVEQWGSGGVMWGEKCVCFLVNYLLLFEVVYECLYFCV